MRGHATQGCRPMTTPKKEPTCATCQQRSTHHYHKASCDQQGAGCIGMAEHHLFTPAPDEVPDCETISEHVARTGHGANARNPHEFSEDTCDVCGKLLHQDEPSKGNADARCKRCSRLVTAAPEEVPERTLVRNVAVSETGVPPAAGNLTSGGRFARELPAPSPSEPVSEPKCPTCGFPRDARIHGEPSEIITAQQLHSFVEPVSEIAGECPLCGQSDRVWIVTEQEPFYAMHCDRCGIRGPLRRDKAEARRAWSVLARLSW